VSNHAHAALACDLFLVATATFRLCYVFVVLEIGTRRIVHWNVTRHPSAAWTSQQFRMITPGDHRYVLHDRDSIYSDGVDRTLTAMAGDGAENAGTGASGERLLRTSDRHG
jgi:hypothetical protein